MTMEKQQISALIDGELTFSDGCASVAKMLQEPADSELLGRYQLFGAAMRGDTSLVNLNGLFERIHDSIADEPTVLAPTAAVTALKRDNWWGRFGLGSAIAASVALLVIVGVSRLEVPESGNQLVADSLIESALTPVAESGEEIAVARYREADPEEVNRYLVDHGDYVSNGSLMPLATMVSYDGF